jgi:uncharacterized membrane protein YwaF
MLLPPREKFFGLLRLIIWVLGGKLGMKQKSFLEDNWFGNSSLTIKFWPLYIILQKFGMVKRRSLLLGELFLKDLCNYGLSSWK